MIKVESVSFSFGTHKILDDVCCYCERGETIGIIGRSGSGKTTLLNLISGYIQTQFGSISIDSLTPKKAAYMQRIGYVFQTPTLMPWLNIAENTELPLRIKRNTKLSKTILPTHMGRLENQGIIEAAVYRALCDSHIQHAAEKLPAQLSGGMQTRASIARAIVYRPNVLLLDEPFSALDDIVKESLYRDLQEVLADLNAATVLVTHNLSEAVLLCDRVYVLNTSPEKTEHTIVHCEAIRFDKPRDMNLLGDPEFIAARKRIRENLE